MFLNERVEMGIDAADVRSELVVLHKRLKRIARIRGALDVQEAESLRDAQRLQLWRAFGYASLADYMTNELGYSFRTAEDRLRMANALPQLPKLTEALQTGNLNFSQARELARVATPDTEQVWIDKAADLNVRQVEQAVAGHCKGDLPDDPIDPRLVRKTLWLSVRPETDVLFREARKVLDKERGEKLDDDAVLEALCRGYLRGHQRGAPTHVGADKVGQRGGSTDVGAEEVGQRGGSTHVVAEGVGQRGGSTDVGADKVGQRGGATHVAACDEEGAPTGDLEAEVPCVDSSRGAPGTPSGISRANRGAPYRVAVTVCRECKRGWKHGGGLVEEMTPPAVETAMCDAQWIGDLDSNIVERARQEISEAMRRKVMHRDQERCQAPGCRAHNNLDVHHVVHIERGGTNEYSNLITLCEAHHLAHHAGTLVIARVNGELVFRREGRDNFTRATREVETKKALHTRGFDRELVKEILARTVTHVGGSDLSVEQWLTIALRYAEKTAM